MLHDYMQLTYLVPTLALCAGVIMLIVLYIKSVKEEDLTQLKKVSGYTYWILAVWAFILFALLMVEEVFRGNRFNDDVLKTTWPMLLSLLVVFTLAFIRKYRIHPGGLLVSCAIIIAGYYSFVKVLENLGS